MPLREHPGSLTKLEILLMGSYSKYKYKFSFDNFA